MTTMTEPACPQCHLPIEQDAWQCDGCGHVFRRDFEQVRRELQAKLKRSQIAFWVTLLVGLGIAGGLVYLATQGFIFVSVPLIVAILGGIGHTLHTTSVLRGHLRELDRRHVPLPKATAIQK
jgi:hypothetical protein